MEVHDEPIHRRQFSNEYVYVYIAGIRPGETSLWHRHSENTLYVCVEHAAAALNRPTEKVIVSRRLISLLRCPPLRRLHALVGMSCCCNYSRRACEHIILLSWSSYSYEHSFIIGPCICCTSRAPKYRLYHRATNIIVKYQVLNTVVVFIVLNSAPGRSCRCA